jgi:hypothetical protein
MTRAITLMNGDDGFKADDGSSSPVAGFVDQAVRLCLVAACSSALRCEMTHTRAKRQERRRLGEASGPRALAAMCDDGERVNPTRNLGRMVRTGLRREGGLPCFAVSTVVCSGIARSSS